MSKWAEEQGRGDAFHKKIFHAYFAEGLNIADMKVLKDVCFSVGLDPHEVVRIFTKDTYKKMVHADWGYAAGCGVTVVPTFSIAGHTLVGAQPYVKLEKMIRLGKNQGLKGI